jgi:ankyrin repeat protein
MSPFELLSAASVGDLQLLQQLLDGGLSPEAGTPAGWTALHAAAMAGQLESMQLLLQRGAPVEAATLQGGYVPLHSAARAGQMGAMQLLLGAKAKVHAADHKGKIPLFHATLTGSVGSVQVLLDAGADASCPLRMAAWHGHYQLVRLLISRGANVNQRSQCKLQEPVLHVAARRGPTEIVQELLAAGADVSAVDARPNRLTALHMAAQAGHHAYGIVQLLLAHGADVNATDGDGVPALQLAVYLGQAEVVKLLLAAGACVQHASLEKGLTALHRAAAGGNVEVTELLLSAGADIEARDRSRGSTPLHVATFLGHAAVACKLLAAGADVTALTDTGHTALMLTAQFGQLEVVQVLVASGADSQHALVDAARRAAVKGHGAIWAFLARKVHGMSPEALGECVAEMDIEVTSQALISEWEGAVERHEKILEAARRERADGESARQQAQKLFMQTALMKKQLVRSMSDREKAELVQMG